MSMLDDPQILKEIIMDHYKYPRNHQLKENETYDSSHMASSSCIDDITVQALIVDDVIKEINFDGVACTISTASTSIMTELLQDKSINEAKEIIEQYFKMINEDDYNAEVLEEAVCMKGVSKQASRIKCATIGWQAIKEIIERREAHEE